MHFTITDEGRAYKHCNKVTHRIFNTDLSYSYAHFVVDID